MTHVKQNKSVVKINFATFYSCFYDGLTPMGYCAPRKRKKPEASSNFLGGNQSLLLAETVDLPRVYKLFIIYTPLDLLVRRLCFAVLCQPVQRSCNLPVLLPLFFSKNECVGFSPLPPCVPNFRGFFFFVVETRVN